MNIRCMISSIRKHTAAICRRYYSRQVHKDLTLVVTKEEVEETLDFLGHTFVRNEPIIQAMDIDNPCDLLRYIKRQLTSDAVTLKLIDKQCDIISAVVCVVITPKASKDSRFFAECSVCDPNTKRLIHLWNDINDSHDLFKCLKVDKIWDISYTATALEAQGKGLTKLLVNEARLVGKKEGLAIARMDCTSHYSAKIAADLKFVTLPPRHVMTYRDKKGRPWLPKEPPHPHGHVITAYDFLT